MAQDRTERCIVCWIRAGLILLGVLLFGVGAVNETTPAPTGPSLSPDSIAPISEVRVDADGDYVPDRLGDTVDVAGRAVAQRDVFFQSEFIVLQGPSGGIHVSVPEGVAVNRGDSVQVRGVVEHEYGLTQLQSLNYDVADAKPREPAPVPLTVHAAAGESYEGRLVRIRGHVVRVGSNDGGKYLIINDQGDEKTAQISVFVPNRRLGQMELARFEAGDEVEVTGVLGQHDYEEPYTEYYQVLPRDSADLAHTGWTSTYLWIVLSILLGGGVLAVVAVTMLRTAVRRRTRELAESQARFKRLAEATSEGIVIHEDGQIVSVNETLVEMTGHDREELIGQELNAALADLAHDLDETSLADAKEERTEAEVVREDGTTVPVEIEAREITVGDHPAHVVAVRDISKRKEWEEGILQAKQEAEEAARLKSAMLANMSHEIRTPLTSIIGFSEMLEDNLDGKMAEFAEKAHHSSQRLMETLDSVLQLSKLEAGTFSIKREPVRLDRVAEETVNLLRPRAEEKSVALAMRMPEKPVEGLLNEGALNRILENLIGNAIKFTPENGCVEVRMRESETEAVLEVEDSGVGIEKGAQTRIFEAFEQESGGLDREYEGSGLGLSIVQRLTEVHGGAIDVESSKGEGSTFTVKLPLLSDNGELPDNGELTS